MRGNKDDSKVRVIAVYNMLKEGKRVKAREIMQRLECRYDITANRKTIYDDVCCIDKIMPIDVKFGPHGGFKLFDFKEAE